MNSGDFFMPALFLVTMVPFLAIATWDLIRAPRPTSYRFNHADAVRLSPA